MSDPGGEGGASRGETVQRLAGVERRLAALSADIRRELAKPESERASAASDDSQPAEGAAAVCGWEMDLALVKGLDRHLAESRRALEKWDARTYGRCDRCGQAIASERLEARPESVLCLRCAAAADREGS